MLSPTSAVLEQDIAVRDIVTNEGVDVRDFASPEALADKSSDAFTEYAHYITTTNNLPTSANTALRSSLRGVSSKTEDRLAEENSLGDEDCSQDQSCDASQVHRTPPTTTPRLSRRSHGLGI